MTTKDHGNLVELIVHYQHLAAFYYTHATQAIADKRSLMAEIYQIKAKIYSNEARAYLTILQEKGNG